MKKLTFKKKCLRMGSKILHKIDKLLGIDCVHSLYAHEEDWKGLPVCKKSIKELRGIVL